MTSSQLGPPQPPSVLKYRSYDGSLSFFVSVISWSPCVFPMFFHPLTYPLLSDHPLPCVSSCQCDCLPCPNWFHLCLITYLVSCVYIALPSVVKVCLCTSTSSIPAIFLLVFMSSFFFDSFSCTLPFAWSSRNCLPSDLLCA